MVSPVLKRYLLALDRYKWAALASFLSVVGASTLVALQAPRTPQYQAQGTLVQNFPLVTFTTTGSEVQQQGKGIISEQFLLADVLLQQVSQALASRGINLDPEQIRDRITLAVESEEGQIQQVTVTFAWPAPDEAQTILEVLFEGMVELSRVTNRARQRAIVNALEERLPQVEAELRQAEQALEAYDRLEGPAIQSALDGTLLGAISSSQQQRRQNQILLAGLEAQIQNLQRQLGMSADEALTASALSADPIIAQLRAEILAIEAQLQILTADLREAHPTIQELRNNLAAYNTLLAERAAEVIGGGDLADLPSVSQVRQNSTLDPARATLANQLVVLDTQRDAIEQQQQVLAQSEVDLRQQYGGLPNKQLERNRLAQQVALKQALYDQIQARRIDAAAAEAETVSSITIAEPVTLLPQVQASIGPGAVMAMGSLLGLTAAGLVVLLLDQLDDVARTPEELIEVLTEQELPLLGLVPTLPAAAPQQPPLLLGSSAPYTFVYERLRSNVQLMGEASAAGHRPRLVLISSTRPQEGKTVTAFNLAIAAARAGQRTLLVEANLHRPSQGWQLGVQLPAGAIHEPLRYYAGQGFEPVQMVPAVENLYFAAAPGPQAYPAAVLESSELDQFLAMAKARFDWVILVAPALSSSNDARVLGHKTDGLILVTRPGLTAKPALDATLDQLLEGADPPVLGAIINGADQAASLWEANPAQPFSTMATVPGNSQDSPAARVRSVDF